MCGIAALLARPTPVDRDTLQRGLVALQHRGPDGAGTWVAPDARVALGHTRLAIIDLEGGAQPIANEDGTVVATVNGELYGFERIRAALEREGHRFSTRSDSEILVHLYERDPTRFWDHLRGEFAFVLWDEKLRTLLAARDRFGVKPICWAQRGGRLFVASEAKALFAMGLPARWDTTSLLHATSHQYVPPHRTMFEGVHAIAPGHVLRVTDETIALERWWDLDVPRESERVPVEADEAVARVRASLEESVRLRLRADVPVAFQLSGGIDSSAVLGCAAQHARALHAFTVAFDDPTCDESALAEATARHAGATLHVVRATPEALVEALPRSVELAEGLAINAHLPAKWLLSKAIRDATFKVVLTGEGSDEIFSGYPHLRRDLFLEECGDDVARAEARLRALDATNAVSAGVQLPHGAGLPLVAVQHALGFVPSFLAAKATLGLRLHSLLSRDMRGAVEGRDAYARLLRGFDVEGQLRGRARVDQSAWLWTKTALATSILRILGDGTEMAHSVEGRVPFLDHELFAVARALPVSLRIRDGVEKWVLREAVRPWVTAETARRQKHPFMAPTLSTHPAMRALVLDLLEKQDIWDRAAVTSLFDRLPQLAPAERTAWDAAAMSVATTLLLQRAFRLEA